MSFPQLFKRKMLFSEKEIRQIIHKVKEESNSEFDRNKFIDIIKNTSNIIAKSSFANISDHLESIKNQIKLIPQKYKASISLIYDNGWYLDPSIAFFDLLSFSELTPAEIDNYLIAYYRRKAKYIQNNLGNYFQKRMTIINKAFDAHYKKEYELSIPVFLSQSDGIIFDRFEKAGLFQQKERIKFIKKFKERNVNNQVFLSIIEPLEQDLDIYKTEKNRTNTLQMLERRARARGKEEGNCREIAG